MALSIVILTGASGSGKSTAVRALEDAGYFCIDNMPTPLTEQLIKMIRDDKTIEHLALVMDVRDQKFVSEAPELVATLRQGPDKVRVVYLESREDALIRRYSTTRRRHPLDRGGGLREALARERLSLAPMRELADDTIETTAMSPHELRALISEQIVGLDSSEGLRIGMLSFGFKYGVPLDADIVLDVRFLPNPYFVPELQAFPGTQPAVRDYVIDSPLGQEFIKHTMNYLGFLIPQYQREGKRYLTVAIGCTGGRHRSVALATEFANRLTQTSVKVDIRHRDLQEESP